MDENIQNPSETSNGASGLEFDTSIFEQGGQEASGQGIQAGSNDTRGTEQPIQAPDTFQIDPKYAHLPPAEGAARTWQGKHDSLMHEHEKLVSEAEQLKTYKSLLDQMTQDENLLTTFVNQYKPGLVKAKDLSQTVKETLAKEFGTDGKPYVPEKTREQAEREDPGGKDWLYYRRQDELYQELKKGGGQSFQTLKEYQEAKALQQKKVEAEFQKEIDDCRRDYKMDDTEVQRVLKFGQSLRFRDLTRILRFMSKFPSQSRTIENASGGSVNSGGARQRFLNDTFKQ